jgi:hypothetical protein
MPIEARGHRGTVTVSIAPNRDPETIGCRPWAQDFPVCEARVDFGARGYAAILGWVQVVRLRSPYLTPDDQWVVDPLEVYGELNTPFGFHGIAPTLFDAPSRSDRSRFLDWQAESYLCFAPTSPMAREAAPIAAFSWGFLLDQGQVSSQAPRTLPLSSWNAHLELLGHSYPGWEFLPSAAL